MSSTTPTQRTCPECNGTVREADAEVHCSQCGLVVDADRIDHGPEWVAYTPEERNEKKRTGAPRTERRHDNGLGGQIGAASDNNSEIHSNVERWSRFDTKKTQNQAQILVDVRRLCDRLGLEGDLVDRACRVATEAHDARLAYGRSLELIGAAAVFATCREHGLPVTVAQLIEWTADHITQTILYRVYHDVVDETGIQPAVVDPVEYIPKLTSELELSSAVEQDARKLTLEAQAELLHVGHPPMGIAGSAVYMAVSRQGLEVTQAEIADVADVSTVTIRNNRDEMLEAGLGGEDGE